MQHRFAVNFGTLSIFILDNISYLIIRVVYARNLLDIKRYLRIFFVYKANSKGAILNRKRFKQQAHNPIISKKPLILGQNKWKNIYSSVLQKTVIYPKLFPINLQLNISCFKCCHLISNILMPSNRVTRGEIFCRDGPDVMLAG